MRDLETLNPHPGTATNAMCTFLAINTSSIQLIPATAVAILASQGSRQATAIVGTAFLATCVSTLVGIFTVKLLEGLPAFRVPEPTPSAGEKSAPPVVTGPDSTALADPPAPSRAGTFLLGLLAFVGLILAVLMLSPQVIEPLLVPLRSAGVLSDKFPEQLLPQSLREQNGVSRTVGILSLLAIPYTLAFFTAYAAARGVKVYEEFIHGAREGWDVALRIFPFLVAILVAVRMFRESGGIDLLALLLSPVLQPLGVSPELLPLILIRPLSGSATTGLFTELVTRWGPDSLLARTAATIFGSTETTFYVLAVYFGAVGIRRGRHALAAGLLADGAGAFASIAICRWMFS
jgi:spore maturation protein SpmB